jgi:hypothetical protein
MQRNAIVLCQKAHLMGWSAAFARPEQAYRGTKEAIQGGHPWSYTQSASISARRSFIWSV